MSSRPDGRPLVGSGVRLELLGDDAVDELYPLLSDPQVYADGYVMHRRPVSVEDSRALVTSRFLVAGRVVYAIRLVDGTLVGTSSLLEIDLANESIHLGATLYGRRWWGTAVNPEAKLLLLAHCFDDCGFGRVKIQTDALNTHSQAAIAKLGARREGVLRRHLRREDGTFRDTVVYSILADEWPDVRARPPRPPRRLPASPEPRPSAGEVGQDALAAPHDQAGDVGHRAAGHRALRPPLPPARRIQRGRRQLGGRRVRVEAQPGRRGAAVAAQQPLRLRRARRAAASPPRPGASPAAAAR